MSEGARHPGISVLVIDSNADVRHLYIEILNAAGYAVRAVASTREALAVIAEAAPDVAVLALRINGGPRAVIEALRPPGGSRKVGLVLASGARDLPQRAAELEALYLAKPFTAGSLAEIVARAASA